MITLFEYIEKKEMQNIIHQWNKQHSDEIVNEGMGRFFKKLFKRIKDFFTKKDPDEHSNFSWNSNYRDNTIDFNGEELKDLFVTNGKPTQIEKTFPYIYKISVENYKNYLKQFTKIKTLVNEDTVPIAIVLYTEKENAKSILLNNFDEERVNKLNKPVVGLVEFNNMVEDKKTRIKVFNYIAKNFGDPFVFFGEDDEIENIYKQHLTEKAKHFYIYKKI